MKLNMRYMRGGLAAIAAAWAAGSGGAEAYGVGDYVQYFGYVTEGSAYDTTSAAVQNSTLVTERRVMTVASETQANMIERQIAARFDGSAPVAGGTSFSLLPQTGGNAGAGDRRGSLWGSVGYDNMREQNISRFGGWNANLWTVAVGYDYKFNDKVLAGLALTYSNLNGKTAFNNGNMRDNAYGLVPYVAFRVSPCFDIDLMLGYSRVNKKRDRAIPTAFSGFGPGGAFVPAPSALGGPITNSSPKSDRYFAALYANYKHRINHWNLLARLGYMYITDRQKAFSETFVGQLRSTQYGKQNTNSNRVSLRLQAGYKVNPCVEPYAFLLYAHDFGATKIRGVQTTVTPNSGGVTVVDPNRARRNETYGGGLGLNATLAPNFTSGIEATYAQSSKKFRDIGGMVNVKWAF